MKNIIKVMVLPLIIINGLFASQQSQGFATSIFWQAAPNAIDAEFMFSNLNPAGLKDVYTTEGLFKEIATNQELVNAFNTKVFSPYVVGYYFGGSGEALYVTGKTDIPPRIKKPTQQPAVMMTMYDVRLAALGLKNVLSPEANENFNFNFTHLMKLGYIITQSPTLITPFVMPSSCIGCSDGYTSSNPAIDQKLWYAYNKHNVAPIFILKGIVGAIIQVFDPSLIKQKTNLTIQSFMPVAGVKMQGNTYFAQDNILFALHLITPGKGTTKLTKNTSLADVMQYQNTYPDMYPLEGVSPCGDNFGF